MPVGAIFGSYVIQGYSDAYPDVHFNDYVRPTAQLVAREMARRCLAEPEVFVSVVSSMMLDKSIWATDPTTGPLATRLAENIPSGPITAPLLLGQGLADALVLPASQDAYVKQRCDAGYPVDYRTYKGFDHVGFAAADSPLIPDLLAWTKDRIDGAPATPPTAARSHRGASWRIRTGHKRWYHGLGMDDVMPRIDEQRRLRSLLAGVEPAERVNSPRRR